MNLYKISQSVNNDYDTYSDAVVCAENEDEARKIHPNGAYDYKEEWDNREGDIYHQEGEDLKRDSFLGSWVKKHYVKVEYIGVAKEELEKGVVCASYHAG